MNIDFIGVSEAEQSGIRGLFEAVLAADEAKDAEAMLALLSRDVEIEVEGMGVLDRIACEASIREQVRDGAESRMEYPTLYVEFREGAYLVEGTYRGYSDGKLAYEGSVEMRLVRRGDRFFIRREKMIPSLHAGRRLGRSEE